MYGTPQSVTTMNGMGGDVIDDGSGTIDPANLSNSGMFRASLFLVAYYCCFPARLRFLGLIPIVVATWLHATPHYRSAVIGLDLFLNYFFFLSMLFPVTFQTDLPPSLCPTGTIPIPCWTKSSWYQA